MRQEDRHCHGCAHKNETHQKRREKTGLWAMSQEGVPWGLWIVIDLEGRIRAQPVDHNLRLFLALRDLNG